MLKLIKDITATGGILDGQNKLVAADQQLVALVQDATAAWERMAKAVNSLPARITGNDKTIANALRVIESFLVSASTHGGRTRSLSPWNQKDALQDIHKRQGETMLAHKPRSSLTVDYYR